MRNFRANCTIGVAFAAFLITSTVSGDVPPMVDEVLTQMSKSFHSVSYQGTFIYSDGNAHKSIEVVRRVKGADFHEKLTTLTGDRAEIIRTNQGVWCYFPERNAGHYKPTIKEAFSFSRIVASDIAELRKLYKIKLSGQERVAGRWANRVRFSPKDDYRYGVQIWVDDLTGVILRIDMMNLNGKTVDSFAFINLKVESDDQSNLELASMSQPVEFGKNYTWKFSVPYTMQISDSESMWDVRMVPDGFKKLNHFRSEVGGMEREQIIFSDLVSSVSLVIQSLNENDPELNKSFVGGSQLGSVNAYGRLIDNYQITVVGEVPPKTVRVIGESVRKKY